jgi:hypothetical protein
MQMVFYFTVLVAISAGMTRINKSGSRSTRTGVAP